MFYIFKKSASANVSQYIILITLCIVCTTIFNIDGQCNLVKIIMQEAQIVMQKVTLFYIDRTFLNFYHVLEIPF